MVSFVVIGRALERLLSGITAVISHMTPEFAAKLETKMSDYRAWASGRYFSGVRLVQYCGVEMIGARDIVLLEVEHQIKGCICEGFGVEWAEHNGRLYLCAWEAWDPPGRPPDWASVFSESDLVSDHDQEKGDT